MRAIKIGLVLAVSGCSNPFDAQVFCTAQLGSTLSLRITNATTGAAEGAGSTVIVRNAIVYDSVTLVSQFADADYKAWEDKVGRGEYTVTVRKPGFITQSFQATVTADECHAGPGPHIEVRLVPAP